MLWCSQFGVYQEDWVGCIKRNPPPWPQWVAFLYILYGMNHTFAKVSFFLSILVLICITAYVVVIVTIALMVGALGGIMGLLTIPLGLSVVASMPLTAGFLVVRKLKKIVNNVIVVSRRYELFFSLFAVIFSLATAPILMIMWALYNVVMGSFFQ